jgi:DNA-binding PadR family transcriptional regulator
VEEGLVTFSTERLEGRPEKKVYTISEKGQEELKNWLRGPIDFESGSYGGIFKVKVFFGANIGKDVTIKHITDVLEYENGKLAELLVIEQRMNQNREKELESGGQSFIYRLSILQEGISAKKAQIKWCEDTILNIKQYSSKK